mmetsp:Transcript_31417/g.61494  ORF Transcript_31417/g.61494 Transcript_31417/m.61494 type:complete len:221 (+) Transcript_31417:252-914(+)
MYRGYSLFLFHLFGPPVPGETPDRGDNSENLEVSNLVLEVDETGDDDDEAPEDAGDLVREDAEPLQDENGADGLQPVGHDTREEKQGQGSIKGGVSFGVFPHLEHVDGQENDGGHDAHNQIEHHWACTCPSLAEKVLGREGLQGADESRQDGTHESRDFELELRHGTQSHAHDDRNERQQRLEIRAPPVQQVRHDHGEHRGRRFHGLRKRGGDFTKAEVR